jgi:hypothetical protein
LLLRAYGVLIEMKKQARRLWLGDWRTDEEARPQPAAADPAENDTVVLTPLDDGDARRAERKRNIQRAVAGGAVVAVLCALGFSVSSGDDKNPVTPTTAQVPPAQAPQTQIPPAAQAPQQGFGGPDLAGAEATRAAQAAVAKYPGNVERVTRGPSGGGYVVHVIQPDGNEVHVAVDDQFKVQGSDAGAVPQSGTGSGSGTPQ